MALAKQGDTVLVDYTGMLEDGTVFDSSVVCPDDDTGSSGPFKFTVGTGEVIAGFDSALLGMGVGESKRVRIAVDQAYGERSEDLVLTIDRGDLPVEIVPEPGCQLQFSQENGDSFQAIITEVADNRITLDANHPLAGRVLIFDITLVEIC